MTITDYVAIYAALVASTALIWNIIRDRPRVLVKIWVGNPANKANKPPYELIGIKVINRGSKAITVHDIGFTYSDGNYFRVRIPQAYYEQLKPLQRDSVDFTVPIVDLKEDLTGMAGRTIAFAWARDATDKVYKGKIPKAVREELTD